MARNVHTKEGTPPETTGRRGPNLSRAQARVLRLLRDQEVLLCWIEPGDVIGQIANSVHESGVYVLVSDESGFMRAVSALTVIALYQRGLLEQVETRDPQCRFDITDAGRAALEAGNIG